MATRQLLLSTSALAQLAGAEGPLKRWLDLPAGMVAAVAAAMTDGFFIYTGNCTPHVRRSSKRFHHADLREGVERSFAPGRCTRVGECES